MANVLPWKESFKERILFLFSPYFIKLYFLANFKAPSLASAPELAKNTLLILDTLVNLSANSTVGVLKKIFERWVKELSWFKIASFNFLLL